MFSLTKVVYAVASLVQGSGVKFQTDDCKNENSKHDEKTNLHQGCQSLENGLQDHL